MALEDVESTSHTKGTVAKQPAPVRSKEPVSLAERRWHNMLLLTGKGDKGKIKGILFNVLIPLRHSPTWEGVLRYNSFSHVIEVVKQPPWPVERDLKWQVRPWTDYDDFMFTAWLQKEGIDVQTRLAYDGILTVATENSYHPVRGYLNGLEWDGVERLNNWLHIYLGAEDSEYHTAVGMRWLVAGVARILNPGPDCKADYVLILEGEQGLQKSTALRILSAPWFLDDLRQFGSKDAAMKIAGRWIVEIAELTAMNEQTIEACKGFFSQTMDSFRPPYGRRIIDAPRQCIFAASTNKNVFLKDETGDRRYWPVLCTKINVELLKNDRDQLWAEAKALYMRGQRWWLDTPELRALAEEEQRMRFEADPWEVTIRKNIRLQTDTTPEYVLRQVFDFEVEEITKAMRNRVSSILRHLKWQRIRRRDKQGHDEYVWIRKVDTLP